MEQVLTPFEKFLQFLPYLIPLVVLTSCLLVIASGGFGPSRNNAWRTKVGVGASSYLYSTVRSIVYFVFGRKE